MKKSIFLLLVLMTLSFHLDAAKQRVLIGSCVTTSPELTKVFLRSVDLLEKRGIDVDYLFVDAHRNKLSSSVVEKYLQKKPGQLVLGNSIPFPWKTTSFSTDKKALIEWKMASYRNHILHQALDGGYDYVFVISPTAILHPKRLKHMMHANQEIVTDEDQSSMLISRAALIKGASYNRLYNLSAPSPDVHFSIRASALDIPLFTDSEYQGFILDEASKIEEAKAFLRITKRQSMFSAFRNVR